MAFNSFYFWLIFPFIFAVYWMIPARWLRVRNGFLLIVSYMLYMNWNPAFALVLLGVTAITYVGAIVCESYNEMQRQKKVLSTCFTVMGLLPLIICKYYNFLNDGITTGLEACGLHFALPGLNWAIPVGISFFTFQAVGYLLDVYHKRVKAERRWEDYALFVSFFPQVTSGPISTAKELMPQFKTVRPFRYNQCVEGLKILLWGMFLKCVVADRL
ncbi:MAG: MBOAT family protein, partial [Prevotella sp.]|nr:MBOAT family protein [Candidatus Prevotella equi]